MKISRLYRPRSPQFWLLIVLNLLSSVLSFILRTYDLPVWLMLGLAGFAIANLLLGMWIAWRLISDETASG